MRVIHRLAAAVLLCAGAASTSHAGPAGSLILSLDVPEERAPARLCVLTSIVCGPDSKPCDNTARLNSVAGFFDDRADRPSPFRAQGGSESLGIPLEIASALRSLAAVPPETRLCSGGGYGACAPEIDLREFHTLSASGQPVLPLTLHGQIVCGSQRRVQGAAHVPRDGSGEREPHAEPASPQRVALLSLAFHDSVPDGIDGLVLEGTVARVQLTHAKSTRVTVQVIGGDYAISQASAFAADQIVNVRLRPRCGRFFAEVPAHRERITAVELERGKAHHTCVPKDPMASIIPIELPFTSAGEDKLLTVRYAGDATSEVRWFESVPPTPLRLGARSLRFSWRRPVDCLADRWTRSTPGNQADDFTPVCPRATLSSAKPCQIVGVEPSFEDPKVCRYRCDIPEGEAAVSLPIPVVFERVRSHADQPGRAGLDHAEPEVLYGWRDQIDDADQELTSVVPPADRRVMVEFPHPEQWQDRLGDEIDEIRVYSARSANRLDLLDLNHTETPPHWISLPSAGRTCGDRIRVAIVGTWRYEERTFDGAEGRIELIQPEQYRRRTLFYGLAGTGGLVRHLTSNAHSSAFLDLGFGLLIDPARRWPSLRSLLLDVEATGQIAHTFYEGIELSRQQPADFTAVPYLRFDLRVAVEWWWRRRVGLAVAGGFGLGTPLSSDDARAVGALRRSELFELHPVIFALLPTRLWFLAGGGVRIGEQHRDYRTDFLGSPTPDRERDPQWYLFLRFRTALE